MLKLKIIILFLVSTQVVNSQNASDLPPNSFPFNLGGTTLKEFDSRYEGVKGTYTFMEKFSPGNIQLRNTLYNNALINYDAVNDVALVKKDTSSEAYSLRKDLVESFTLFDNLLTYQFKRVSLNGAPTYLIAMTEEKLKIYCKVTKTLRQAEIGGAYNTSEKKYDEFVLNSTYYLKTESGFTEIQKSKNGLGKAFSQHKDEVIKLLKSRRVDFNDLSLMQEIFLQIESLY